MTTSDVVIVGAGLAGLTAAFVLHSAGVRVTVLEAAAQIGGRIQAVRDEATGTTLADLGPTWVWPPFQPIVARWLARLAMATFEQENHGNAVVEGFGGGLRHQPLPGQHGMLRIKGGPSALISALAGHLPKEWIRTGAQVARIEDAGPGALRLTLDGGEHLTTGRVILAVPLRVAAQDIALPDLPAQVLHMMRATPTWMSAQAKAVALYPRPFWRDAGLSGRIASQYAPLFEAHDHCSADGQAAVFGFVSWTPERRQAEPEALRKAILEQLARCLGPAGGAPTELILMDWAQAPLICSARDLEGAPQHPAVGPDLLRAAHLGGKLRLAVAETATDSPGLIEGALSAGERAARNLLAAD